MPKNTYWISDPNGGAKALVEGVEERNRWTQINGWTESDEPVSGDMVWVFNPSTEGRAKLPADSLAEGSYWRGVGWTESAPAEPVDLTKDPALRDQEAPTRATPRAAATPTTSASADKSNEGVTRG
jgi:hypothetical protein